MTQSNKHFDLKSNIAEILIGAIVLILFFYYVPIGEISGLRGLNLAPYMTTPLDRIIPFNTFWIIFYGISKYVIASVIVLIRLKVGANIKFIQRMALTYLAIILMAYVLFLLTPSSVIKMFGIPNELWRSGSWLNQQTVYEYRHESPWNSNPSLHIGMSWLTYRFFAYVYKNKIYHTIYMIWFLGMLIGTLCLKVHVICNLVCGFILAEGSFRMVFHSDCSDKLVTWLDSIVYYKKIILYLMIIAILTSGLFICDHYLGVLDIVNTPHITTN
jgi:hypothetical protein